MSVGGVLAAPIGAIGLATGVGQVSSPAQVGMSANGAKTLNAYQQNAPQQLSLTQQYLPQYTGAGVSAFNAALNGWQNDPGIIDVLSTAEPALNNLTNQNTTSQRTAGVNDLMSLAPGITASYVAANPGEANLLGNITGTADNQLSYGYGLSPAQERQVTQTVRQGQADRGMGYGPIDQYGEALGVSQYGNQLFQQRQQNANQAANTYASVMPNPVSSIWSMPLPGMNYQNNIYGMGQGISAYGAANTNYTPWTQYASNVYDYNANATNANQINNANVQAGMIGGMMSSFGGSKGAGISALMM